MAKWSCKRLPPLARAVGTVSVILPGASSVIVHRCAKACHGCGPAVLLMTFQSTCFSSIPPPEQQHCSATLSELFHIRCKSTLAPTTGNMMTQLTKTRGHAHASQVMSQQHCSTSARACCLTNRPASEQCAGLCCKQLGLTSNTASACRALLRGGRQISCAALPSATRGSARSAPPQSE